MPKVEQFRFKMMSYRVLLIHVQFKDGYIPATNDKYCTITK